MNNFKIFIIIAFIITTTLVCMIKPELHKRVVIGDANLSVEQEQDYEKNQVPQKTFKQLAKKTKKQIVENENSPQESPNNKEQKRQTQANAGNQPSQQKQTSENKPGRQTPPQNVQNNLPPQQHVQQPQRNASGLTPEQEEIIAWNKWRSNLENQVMRDANLGAPIGTVFKFSFTVDKYGTISNFKTWSTNSDYTPMAVRSIKPVILSYQGRSILNFPPKSKRVLTNVVGGFKIWTSTNYYKPSDFSDYERIHK